MQNVTKKSGKNIEEYRHNIKLLKYHLKKEQKINETLKYKESRKNIKQQANLKLISEPKDRIYGMFQTVAKLNLRLKDLGLVLGDIFRMGDSNYEGEITKQQFMKTVLKLKSDVQEHLLNEMFYAIDTNLNGMLSDDEYNEFLYAHGGSQSQEARIFQKTTSQKFLAALKKKGLKPEQFIQSKIDPFSAYDFTNEVKKFGLNGNEAMILLKMYDPSQTGSIRHELFKKSMQNVKAKDQKQIANEKFDKGIKQLCVLFRERKLNPLQIFEEADVDGQAGVSVFELEEEFKKMIPEQTTFQIKKWVSLINLNGDNEITKEQFLSSIRSFYSLIQLDKFSVQYDKLHPKLKKALEQQQIPSQKILKQLQEKIEDKGLSKTQVFHHMDINGNGTLDKQQLAEGLKSIGVHAGFVGKVLSIFDRDSSGEISLDEWLKILGEDVQMQDLDVPENSSLVKAIQVKDNQKIKNVGKQANPKAKKVQKSNIQTKKETKFPITKKQPQNNIKKTSEVKKENISKPKIVEPKVVQPPLKDKKNEEKSKKDVASIQKSVKQTQKPPENLKKSTSSNSVIGKNPTVKPILKNSQSQKNIKDSKKLPDKAKKGNIFAEDEPESIPDIKKTTSQIQEQKEVDTEEIEKQVASKYRKNNSKVLELFKSKSKRSKNGVIQKQLGEALRDLKLKASISDEQLKYIFDNNISSGGIVKYKDWLDSLCDKFEGQLDQLNQEAPAQENIEQAKQQEQNNLIDIKKKPLQSKIDQIPKEEAGKRGETHEDFQHLMNVTTQNQVHSDEGYKLRNFIDAKDEIALLENQFIPKSQRIKKNKKIFQDKNFPAALSSITNKTPDTSDIEKVTLIKWKHYKQIYKNPKLVCGAIEPNDIRQGILGDCYFLCSLASLAEYKNLIERLFEYYDIDNGYFLVWLCIDGVWKLIELDGYIPCDPTGKKPYFSCGLEEQLWVILLEKAYAKAYGNYEKIGGGLPYEAIKDLTGAPGQSFSHKKLSVDELWTKLIAANRDHFIMTCGTDQNIQAGDKMDGHIESVTNEGIVLGHAYSILNLVQVKNEKIIELRNPWGQTEWKGDWSDQSKKWTPQLKAQLGYQSSDNDGIFWMPFNVFFSKYATTAINYIRPNYQYSSSSEKKSKSYMIKIPKGALNHGFFMVTQQDHRKEGLPINTPYVMCHVIAISYKNGKVTKLIADEKYLLQRQSSVELSNIQKDADVMIIVNLQKQTNTNICYYADRTINYSIERNPDTIMNYVEAIAFMEENAKNVQTSPNLFKAWMTAVGQIAFYVFKSISKETFSIEVELKAPKNIKIFPQASKRTLKFEPNSTQCIKGKIIDMKESYGFGPMSIQPI